MSRNYSATTQAPLLDECIRRHDRFVRATTGRHACGHDVVEHGRGCATCGRDVDAPTTRPPDHQTTSRALTHNRTGKRERAWYDK